jgi:hypothetical protein
MKQKSFERALHNWEPWLKSIVYARKLFPGTRPHPALSKMKDTAWETLAKLGFPECTLMQCYWLACVFSDYDTENGFRFEELKLPGWFPLPFGFRDEEFINKKFLDLKGGRIQPPVVWDEADLKFWRERYPLSRATGAVPQYVLNTDFMMVLSPLHPVRQYVSRGRPRRPSLNGEVPIPHQNLKVPLLKDTPHVILPVMLTEPITPLTCIHCGGHSLMWDKEDKAFKCLLCARTTPGGQY